MTPPPQLAWLAITIIGALLNGVGCASSPIGDIPLFRAHAWKPLDGADPEGEFEEVRASPVYSSLVMRHGDADGGDLLLTLKDIRIQGRTGGEWVVTDRKWGFPVYRYQPELQTFTVVPDEVWQQAGGPIQEYARSTRSPRLKRDLDNKLFFQDREVTAAGKLVVGLAVAPSLDFAAVMSADGSKGSSLGMSFIGGGVVSGQHYHQILSLDDGRFIGEPVRLPFSESTFSVCWPLGGNLIVYKSSWNGQLAFVPFDHTQEPRP